jgi:hypothetical protein
MSAAPKIYELHIQPTYAVYIPQRDTANHSKTEAQRENERNLSDNDHVGKLSRKAVRRLTNAVNWLVASAKKQYVYDRSTNKRYSFKVNFVTLTLPSVDHGISDNQFKSVLLHNFINTCRYKFGMKNFIWKVEAQANGNIHAHFTTDTFIHWKDLRRVWNRILIKHGAMDAYRTKHEKMTFDDYCNAYAPKEAANFQQLRNSFNHGQTTNWQDPNSTDVHAVWAVKDLAAYLAKYMSKDDDERRSIKGRLWGCSYNLSAANKLVVEVHSYADNDLIEPLCHPDIKFKPIEGIDKLTGRVFQFGEIFFLHLSDWGTKIKGRLLQLYNEHRFNIRHNIDVQALKAHIVPDIAPPLHYELVVPGSQSSLGTPYVIF